MKTSILDGLNADDKKEIKGLFLSSKRLRDKLIETLNKKINASHTSSLTKEGYSLPSWALNQADEVGYERGIREVISLLED